MKKLVKKMKKVTLENIFEEKKSNSKVNKEDLEENDVKIEEEKEEND